MRPTELATRLRLSPSHVSKLLKSLVARHFLSVRVSPQDKRTRAIEISERGRVFMKAYHEVANSSLERFTFGMSRHDVSRLVELLEQLAVGLGAAALSMQSSSHPLRGPIARITRSMGLLGNVAYSSSGLTALQYQIVSELAIAREPRIAADFVSLFESPPNTISQALRRLEEGRLVERHVSGRDRRSTKISLSELGRRKVEEIEEIGAAQIRRAMSGSPEHEMHELVYLFGKLMGEIPHSSTVVLQSRYEAIGVQGDEAYSRARRFAVEMLAAQKDNEIPETLLSRESRCFMLLCEGAVEAVVELQPRDGKPRMYVYARQEAKARPLEDFARYALRIFFSEYGVPGIECPRGAIPASLALALPVTERGEIERRSVLSDA